VEGKDAQWRQIAIEFYNALTLTTQESALSEDVLKALTHFRKMDATNPPMPVRTEPDVKERSNWERARELLKQCIGAFDTVEGDMKAELDDEDAELPEEVDRLRMTLKVFLHTTKNQNPA